MSKLIKLIKTASILGKRVAPASHLERRETPAERNLRRALSAAQEFYAAGRRERRPELHTLPAAASVVLPLHVNVHPHSRRHAEESALVVNMASQLFAIAMPGAGMREAESVAASLRSAGVRASAEPTQMTPGTEAATFVPEGRVRVTCFDTALAAYYSRTSAVPPLGAAVPNACCSVTALNAIIAKTPHLRGVLLIPVG